MGECILTNFSPNDRVCWSRMKDKIMVNTEHRVTSIHTQTVKDVKFVSMKGMSRFLASLYYGLMASMSFFDRRGSKKYAVKSDEALNEIRKGGYERDGGLKTFIKYSLEGATELAPEEELTLIPEVV